MAINSFDTLRVLIIDDFNSFRINLKKIICELGFRRVDSVGSGEEALSFYHKSHYDLILCDYNLGQGRNGQQLLEELRIKKKLRPQDTFILLSAETSRNVVMSAYDCEPDAYLTKPVTAKVIQQRLKRLLNKRNELLHIYENLADGRTKEGIRLLKKMIASNSRHSIHCQKLLAELYIQNQQFAEAEAIYHIILEMGALDWAQVGLAKLKIMSGEPEIAIKWLTNIIKENPSCMKAYDVLSIALEAIDDRESLQKNMQKAVDISPMSISRQASLASVALENGSAEVATKAFKKTVKYGANSLHSTLENQLGYAEAVARLYNQDPTKAKEIAKDAIKVINDLSGQQNIPPDLKTKSTLLNSQLQAIQGDTKKAKEMMEHVTTTINEKNVTLEIEIEIIYTLIANDQYKKAQAMSQQLANKYKKNQSALEKIDRLLPEPVSEKGKKTLSNINKKGVEAYKTAEYDIAIDYFTKVEKRHPYYLGTKLNLAQALIGKMRKHGFDQDNVDRCNIIFDFFARHLDIKNIHYNRYSQLKWMLSTITSTHINLKNKG